MVLLYEFWDNFGILGLRCEVWLGGLFVMCCDCFGRSLAPH